MGGMEEKKGIGYIEIMKVENTLRGCYVSQE